MIVLRSVSRIRAAGAACVSTGVLVALGACGSSSSSSGGDHPPLPQVTYNGGGLLAMPDIVAVTFAGDGLAEDLKAFGATLTSSSWWSTVTSGDCVSSGSGCVGGGGSAAFVELTTPARASYTDSTSGGPSSFQQWLAAALSAGELPPPAPGSLSNTVYVVYLPQTTTVSLDGEASCTEGGFIGYHGWLAYGTDSIPYAVVVECAIGPSTVPGVSTPTLLQQTTIAASHEFLEASTDPIPPTGYALDEANAANWGWIDVTGGGELADMCVDLLGLNQDKASDGDFTAQRIWSNSRAAANEDPCIPVPSGEVYFNAAPLQSFFVLPVGGSATFEVDAFSFAPMGGWTLIAQDWSDSTKPYLSFSIEGATATSAGPSIAVNDGATVQVTVTLLADPGALDTGEADGAIVSFTENGDAPTAGHFWPFAVMSQADAKDAGVEAASPTRRFVHKSARAPMPTARR